MGNEGPPEWQKTVSTLMATYSTLFEESKRLIPIMLAERQGKLMALDNANPLRREDALKGMLQIAGLGFFVRLQTRNPSVVREHRDAIEGVRSYFEQWVQAAYKATPDVAREVREDTEARELELFSVIDKSGESYRSN